MGSPIELLNDLYHSRDWRVLAVLICAFLALLRMWIFWPLRSLLRTLDRRAAQFATQRYQERSLPGWIFILLFAIFLEAAWIFPQDLPPLLDARGWCLLAFLLLAVGMALHLHAYLRSVIMVLTLRREIEPET